MHGGMEKMVMAAILLAMISGCANVAPATGDYDEEPLCVAEKPTCPDDAPFAVCFFGSDPSLNYVADCDPSDHMHCQAFADFGEVRGEAFCCTTPDCL